jgi:hypothetical protein
MMPQAAIPIAGYLCDLCPLPEYRPKKPRAFGVRWVDDRWWACATCAATYLALLAGEEVSHGRA